MATAKSDYYLIVREPGRKLVAVEGTGADRGIFWDRDDADNTAALLSIHNPQYEYHVQAVAADDRLKGIVARFRQGSPVG